MVSHLPKRYSTIIYRLERQGLCPELTTWTNEEREYDAFFERVWTGRPQLRPDVLICVNLFWHWRHTVRTSDEETAKQAEANFETQFEVFGKLLQEHRKGVEQALMEQLRAERKQNSLE